jgi:hypothetical protein
VGRERKEPARKSRKGVFLRRQKIVLLNIKKFGKCTHVNNRCSYVITKFKTYIREKEEVQSIYSLWPILLFANTDISRHILVVGISILAKSNMNRREYIHL